MYPPPCTCSSVAGAPGAGSSSERGDAAGDHRAGRDLRRRLEPRAQLLVGRAHRLEVGVGGRELGERREQARDAVGQLAPDRLRGRDRLVDVGEDPPGALEQRVAGERELHAVRRAPQQLAAQPALQRAYLAAQRRLGDEEPLGRAPEVQLLGDGDEGAQVAQLDRLGRLRQGQDPRVVVGHAADYAAAGRPRSCASRNTVMPDRPFPSARAARTVSGVFHDDPHRRDATLQLRGAPSHVTWPPATSAPPALAVLLASDERAADPLRRALAVRARCVVLSVHEPSAGPEVAAWAADHAAELGADPARLLVAGHRDDARLAVAVALGARDEGWPPLTHQILVAPRLGPLPASLCGVAPATIFSAGDDDGAEYAARLRAAGVSVGQWAPDELDRGLETLSTD